jgi:hypothetical protein
MGTWAISANKLTVLDWNNTVFARLQECIHTLKSNFLLSESMGTWAISANKRAFLDWNNTLCTLMSKLHSHTYIHMTWSEAIYHPLLNLVYGLTFSLPASTRRGAVHLPTKPGLAVSYTSLQSPKLHEQIIWAQIARSNHLKEQNCSLRQRTSRCCLLAWYDEDAQCEE